MQTRERRALRRLAVVAAWVLGVPVALLGAGAVVQQVQSSRQDRLENDRAHVILDRWAAARAAGPGATVQPLDPSRSTRRTLRLDQWTASADGRTLTLGFFGADGPGSEPCGADYAGRAVVSATGVAVVVRQTTPTYWQQVARFGRTDSCPAIARSRTVDVRLGAPLGGRTVLDLVSGTPLRAGLPVPPG